MGEMTPLTDTIVCARPDGGVSVIFCVPGTDLDGWRDVLIARGDIGANWAVLGKNLTLPPKDEYRNAWSAKGGAVAVDIAKAADLRRAQLRVERAPALAALDVEYQRADERGDAAAKAEIAAKKQALRDVTADPRLDAAKTVDDLRAVKLPVNGAVIASGVVKAEALP